MFAYAYVLRGLALPIAALFLLTFCTMVSR